VSTPKARINHQIRATELRVIGADGANLGVLPLAEAIKQAQALELDLIEISPNAVPPVAKIMDFGKYQYLESKKEKQAKAKAHVIELKTLQVKIGTGDHDLALKAKRASEWLREGHRIKMDLFLIGRSKYMNIDFLKERMERILKFITEDFVVVEPPTKSLKGLTAIIEKKKG
jgi:translation initiation factor IF-3